MMKTKLENNMIDCIGATYVEKQNWAIMIDNIGLVYVENEIEMLWLIKAGKIFDKNHTR